MSLSIWRLPKGPPARTALLSCRFQSSQTINSRISTVGSIEEELGPSMDTQIAIAASAHDYPSSMKLWKTVKQNKLNLSEISYIRLLRLCTAPKFGMKTKTSVDDNYKKRTRSAIEVFFGLAASYENPINEAYFLASKALTTFNALDALRLETCMLDKGIQLSSFVRSNMILACRKQMPEEATRLYRELKQTGDVGAAQMYLTYATHLASETQTKASCEVVEDMILAGYQPTTQICKQLLVSALDTRDAVVIEKVLAWSAALDLKLEKGLILGVLELAANQKALLLTSQTWNIMIASGHRPCAEAYMSVILTFGAVKEDQSMFSALIEMEQEGFKVSPQLVKSIGAMISQSLVRTDDAFYFLQELQRQQQYEDGDEEEVGGGVTRSALNAVIVACGLQLSIDRAFGTLKEMQPSFGLSPDVESYNGVLKACCGQTYRSAGIARALVTEMEQKALHDETVCPNGETWHLLITCFLNHGLVKEVEEEVEKLEYQGVPLLLVTKTLIAHHYLKQGNTDGAMTIIRRLEGEGVTLPAHLRTRLELTRNLRRI